MAIRTRSLLLRGLALLVAYSFTPLAVYAQDSLYLSEQATYCEMFRLLSRLLPGECAQKGVSPDSLVVRGGAGTRSVVLGEDSARAGEDPKSGMPKVMSMQLRVQFDFDSDRLTAEANRVLDRLAAVVGSDLMKDAVLQIVGHADSTGKEAYNLKLSERRAAAVKRYLVERHGIESGRLKDIGKGETEPYDRDHPDHPVNRRVEFINLSSQL